jgi:hypothetical protein
MGAGGKAFQETPEFVVVDIAEFREAPMRKMGIQRYIDG